MRKTPLTVLVTSTSLFCIQAYFRHKTIISKKVSFAFFNLLFLLLFCFAYLPAVSQALDTVKRNPIIFGEFTVGGAGGKAGGGTAYFSLNYQKQSNLFTVRYLANIKLSLTWENISPFSVFPIIRERSNTEEYAALYGLRLVKKGHSFSASAGISFNQFTEYSYTETSEKLGSESSYWGIPYELNIKWFKSRKKRFRIVYGLIPIGKKTALGRSIGFKFYGSLSNNGFVGFGINSGLGYHKRYE